MGRIKTSRKTRESLGFILPGLFFLLAIDLFPLIYSLGISLYSWWLARPRDIRFIGLDNYQALLTDPAFYRATVNSLVFMLGAVPLEFLAGLGMALLFSGRLAGAQVLKTLILLPLFITPVVSSMMWRLILHPDLGVLNYYLNLFGLGRPLWLGTPGLAMASVILLDAWRTIPFMFLVIHAGMEALPREPYEAAAVDGATPFQAFWYVTLPLLKYIMLLAVLIRLMDAFREFDAIFVLTGGGPGTATETIQLLNYRVFGLGHMGTANALSILTLCFVAAMCYALMRLVARRSW